MTDLENLQQQNRKMYDLIIAQGEQLEYFEKIIAELQKENERLKALLPNE